MSFLRILSVSCIVLAGFGLIPCLTVGAAIVTSSMIGPWVVLFFVPFVLSYATSMWLLEQLA